MPAINPAPTNALGDPQLPVDAQLQINVQDSHLWFTAGELRGLGIAPESSIFGGILKEDTPVPPQIYLHIDNMRHHFEEHQGFQVLDQLRDQYVISNAEHDARTRAYHAALDEWEAKHFPKEVVPA